MVVDGKIKYQHGGWMVGGWWACEDYMVVVMVGEILKKSAMKNFIGVLIVSRGRLSLTHF